MAPPGISWKTKNKKMNSSSPDENLNPSKSLFRKIFKKKPAKLSLSGGKENIDDDIKSSVRRSRTLSEIPRPMSIFRHTNSYDFPTSPLLSRGTLFNFDANNEEMFGGFNTGITGSNQSSTQLPLPAATTSPAIDFGAGSDFTRSDGSNSTRSNGISDKKKTLNNQNDFDSLNAVSRSSSLAGQIHCDTNGQNHHVESSRFDHLNHPSFHSKQTSFENDMFYGGNMRSRQERVNNVNSNDELFVENLKLNQRIQEQMKTIEMLKTQLKNEQKRSEAEKQQLLSEHNNELKKKESELVEKEISVIQQLGLSTPTTENSFNCATIENCLNKMNMSEGTPTNGSLHSPGLRPHSLYLNSTPNARPFSSHDLIQPNSNMSISKDRHRSNVCALSNNQLYVSSRSSSTTPDSGTIMSTSPNLIALFRELTIASFHLHSSCDGASKFTNDWLENIRPRICNPNTRATFVEIMSKVEQMQGEDIEHVLEQTVKLLKDCINTEFGLRRDLAELHKRSQLKSPMNADNSM